MAATVWTVKAALAQKVPGLRNGIPSHDTFRRVFSLIDSASLLEAVNSTFTQKKKEAIKEHMYIPLKNWSH